MATSRDIRDRIYNLLSNMSAVTGTVKTVAQYIPKNAQDYEGYIFRVRLQQTPNITRQSRNERTELEQWLIEVFSPPIQINFYDIKENDMYDYRDLVLATFERNPTLELSGSINLVGVNAQEIINGRFTWGTSEFEGFRYKWQCTLQLRNLSIC